MNMQKYIIKREEKCKLCKEIKVKGISATAPVNSAN